ncbi:MAG: aminotransferase class IV [Pseudomonadota bacterium]
MAQVDPRNAEIQVMINGTLYPRGEARVSVFDSVVQGGDAVWEGLRVYDGRIAALHQHIRRLRDSAHALAFADIPAADAVISDVCNTLQANGMRDGAHIRLTLTRGEKITSGMNPRFNQAGPTLIVLAEWKPPVYDDVGIRLVSASTRRNTPLCLDSKIHHNNLLNNILASIEANVAGVDSAVMLDLDGFIAETNDTNLFLIRDGRLMTPHGHACLPGITRGMVLDIAREHGVPAEERNLSLTELYTADEAFTTGTMGELTPVLEVDGREIGAGARGPLTEQLQAWHREHAYASGTSIDSALQASR